MVECVLPPPFKQPVDGDTADWPVYGMLSNGQVIGCDVIVSAVGVVPDGDIWVARADAPIEVRACATRAICTRCHPSTAVF
jgi:hypothetical protein